MTQQKRSEILDAVREILAEGRKLEMLELAQRLGVGRTTLYRWAGDREAVLTALFQDGLENILDEAERAARGSGARRVIDAVRIVMTSAASLAPFQTFLRNEPHLALRLITTGEPIHGRVVAFVQRLIAEERRHAAFAPALDDGTLAYAIVRLGEAFLYSHIISGTEPDLERGIEVITALLNAGAASRGDGGRRATAGRRQR